jgi:carboxypeptidase Taq
MRLNLKEARLDKSTHPFSSQIHPTDVRITTRLDLHNPFENWSSTMHECGHALYEQGLDKTHFGTPFCEALSFGIHESQSRLWENGIGKHPDFWAHYYPLWQSYFPEILKNVPFSSFFSALCEVKPSLIRTQSDELTYNLHIWIRYQLELAVFNGHLSVADLPHEWNKAYTELLGVTPKDDTEGILQDVHWSCGYFGYFPTYSLGNLYAAMLLETLDQSLPLSQHLKTGTLLPIRDWLKTNIHQKGRSVPAKTLIQDITGKPLTETAFVHMMKRRLSV